MFPDRPRRPMPIIPSRQHRRVRQGERFSTSANFLANFQTSDGNLDIEKLTVTGKQVMDLYDQVSPFITKFIKR